MYRHDFIVKIIIILVFLMIPGLCLAEEPVQKTYSLDDCLKLAYQNSEDLKTAALNVSKARYSVKQVEAGFGPTLTYNVAADDISGDIGYTGKISLIQTVYTWGKLSMNLELAQYKLKNALEDERQAKQDLTNNVKNAFYQLWLVNQKLKVVQASYQNMEKHFRNTEQRYQVGTISKFDYLQAEVQWKKLKPNLITAQNNASLSRMNLAVLIGIQLDRLFAIEENSLLKIAPQKIDLTVESALNSASKDRPEMRQMTNNIEIAKLQTKITETAYYSTLALSGNYANNKSESSSFEHTWALTLNLSGILFDNFSTQAKVASAKEDEQILLSNEIGLRNQIRLQLNESFQNLAQSFENIEANKANIGLFEEAFRLTQIKLEEGLATTTDLMDAQLDWDEALNGYYEGICDYLKSVSNLELIMGKTL